MTALRRNVAMAGAPIAFGIGFFALWEGFVRWRDIRPLVLPKPSSIWSAANGNWSKMWEATQVSGFHGLWRARDCDARQTFSHTVKGRKMFVFW